MPSVTDPDKEVDHEEYVEGQVYLLSGVLLPGDALLHPLTDVTSYNSSASHSLRTYFPASMK